MNSESFLDTNILIYAARGKQDEKRKYEVARDLISTKRFGLSAQVLAEFYVGVTRKPEVGLSPAEADRWIDVLSQFPTISIDDTLVRMAILHARRYQIHDYDASSVAAAERLGAATLYTEDLDHGQ